MATKQGMRTIKVSEAEVELLLEIIEFFQNHGPVARTNELIFELEILFGVVECATPE